MATTSIDTNSRPVTPLVTISHSTFATHYQEALDWYLTHEYDVTGPLFDSDVVKTFENFLGCHLFDEQNEERMYEMLGTYLGIIHAGVLLPQRTLRTDVTTLVRFKHPDVKNGYYAGREFYFLDAENDEERATTDTQLLEMWQTIQHEYKRYQDAGRTLQFVIGDMLGRLSGALFFWTAEEHHAWEEESLNVLGYICPLRLSCLIALHGAPTTQAAS